MRIKHSKYKNTGLIFELLVRQITSETITQTSSPAIQILKKHFSKNSTLTKELKLYEFITKNKSLSFDKADMILSSVTEISRKLNQKLLKQQKYDLIADIKEHYDLTDFFSKKIRDYKPLAALYCLLEAQNSKQLIDPQVFVDNKTTIFEHLTSTSQSEGDIKDTLVEEFSKYDKDLKLLTYKILLEKFNNKYDNLTVEQKEILREFITSISTDNKLREYVNERLEEVKSRLTSLKGKIEDEVTVIKLDEIVKNITPLEKGQTVKDEMVTVLLEYFELIKELETL